MSIHDTVYHYCFEVAHMGTDSQGNYSLHGHYLTLKVAIRVSEEINKIIDKKANTVPVTSLFLDNTRSQALKLKHEMMNNVIEPLVSSKFNNATIVSDSVHQSASETALLHLLKTGNMKYVEVVGENTLQNLAKYILKELCENKDLNEFCKVSEIQLRQYDGEHIILENKIN